MAYCIKIFINSLYGKFGQRHFDINVIAHENEINDEDQYKNIIHNAVIQHDSVDIE